MDKSQYSGSIPPLLQIGDVLLTGEIITEQFCCDLSACHGACCVEGDAGAPVTLDEIGEIEQDLDTVWSQLSASAQAVIDRQGVAYTDRDGDLVTSIVGGKDCVFTAPLHLPDEENPDGIDVVGCAFEAAYRTGRCSFCKPVSCALYPIREKQFSDGSVGLTYHRWEVCEAARQKGRQLRLPLYRFLKEPLIRRFGEAWYQELCDVAALFHPEV